MSKRCVGVVTGSRAEYGILFWVLKAIEAHPELDFQLLVTGTHLSPEFGLTVREIESDGFSIAEKIEILMSSDSEVGVSTSIALGVMGFARAFERKRPDILLLLGDRFELLAAAIAAMVARIPIAHISGGKTTQGAIDEAIRHAITKMSHFHFTHTLEHKARIVQMGEEPDRVYVFGAPLVDELVHFQSVSREELGKQLNAYLEEPYLLVVYHPVTLEGRSAGWQMDELLAALETVGHQVAFVSPNADPGGRVIFQKIEEYVTRHPRTLRFVSLRRPLYLQLLAQAAAIVGNSSSGITEAPSLGIPAVNIGDRQRGILKGANVIECGTSRETIANAIKKTLDPAFRREVASDRRNPFGQGNASERIAATLSSVKLDDSLLKKRFYDGVLSADHRYLNISLGQTCRSTE